MTHHPPRPTLFPYTTLFRSWAKPAGKLGKIICRMERLERVLPAASIDEIVPIGYQIDDRTTCVALAERHTAVHAAGSLYLERSEEHTSELQSRRDLVCRLPL